MMIQTQCHAVTRYANVYFFEQKAISGRDGRALPGKKS